MEKKYTEMLYIRLDKKMVADIDNYRREQESIPTVSDAVRQLIKLGLEHQPPN